MSAVAIQPPLPTFDERELFERLDDDAELLVDLAQTFLAQYREQLANLRACADAADFAMLGRHAHGLKGGLLTLSATSARLALELEASSKQGHQPACKELVCAIEDELPKLAADLEALVARLTA